MFKKIDHIGIAVQAINQALEEYQNNFGFSLDFREIIPSQLVEVAFLNIPGTKIELVAPIDKNETLKRFLKKRGPGLHHICYEVDDIHSSLKYLQSLGHTLIDHQPRAGAHNTLIAFIHPKSMQGVLTELCQKCVF